MNDQEKVNTHTFQPEKALDFYQRLGLTPLATEDEIRRSWQMLAARGHPDNVDQSDIEAIKKAQETLDAVNEAYATLRVPRKRQEYDNLLDKHGLGVKPPTPPGQRYLTAEEIFSVLSDFDGAYDRRDSLRNELTDRITDAGNAYESNSYRNLIERVDSTHRQFQKQRTHFSRNLDPETADWLMAEEKALYDKARVAIAKIPETRPSDINFKVLNAKVRREDIALFFRSQYGLQNHALSNMLVPEKTSINGLFSGGFYRQLNKALDGVDEQGREESDKIVKEWAKTLGLGAEWDYLDGVENLLGMQSADFFHFQVGRLCEQIAHVKGRQKEALVSNVKLLVDDKVEEEMRVTADNIENAGVMSNAIARYSNKPDKVGAFLGDLKAHMGRDYPLAPYKSPSIEWRPKRAQIHLQ